MNKGFFVCFIVALFYHSAYAGSDTTYLYYNKDWEKCKKENAFYYGKVYKKDNKVWARQDYWLKGDKLQMEGQYSDKGMKQTTGIFKYYFESGKIEKEIYYEAEKFKTATYYFESGNKRSHIEYRADKSIVEEKGWDENGTEIPNYIVERAAIFQGGLDGWKRFLETNLNAQIAAQSNARPGVYTVDLRFIVNDQGEVKDVEAISVSSGCFPCRGEAIRVLENSPRWVPAIQHNKPVKYQAIQKISFAVDEG